MQQMSHVFDYCGLATQTDLLSSDWKFIYSILEEKQSIFLKKEHLFRSSDYRWPHDALHNWSRIWEYPYVFHHIDSWRQSNPHNSSLKVLDLGSGVTFFPFEIARMGTNVICVDIDAITQRDFFEASKYIECRPGTVDFLLSDILEMNLEDGSIDAVYCISVLEHMREFEKVIERIYRILKPGGLFVLTIDLDLRGDSSLGIQEFFDLDKVVRDRFNFKFPMKSVHPADILNSESSPFGYRNLSGLALIWFDIKQNIVKPWLGRSPKKSPAPFFLAVQGYVLTKK